MRETISERRLASLVAGLVLALVASACAAADPDPASSPASERAPSAPPATQSSAPPATQSPASEGIGGGDGATKDTSEPPVVPEILEFEAPLVGGGTLKGAELAGAPVAVWFWAPW